MKRFLSTFPRWTFSIVWVLIIIWMMDAPTPYNERVAEAVSKYDHLCHVLMGAIMLGFLCVDWQRKHKWQAVRPLGMVVLMIIGFIITAISEVLQIWTPEEYRRWFDALDLMWQAIGVISMAILYILMQPLWSGIKTKKQRPDF